MPIQKLNPTKVYRTDVQLWRYRTCAPPNCTELQSAQAPVNSGGWFELELNHVSLATDCLAHHKENWSIHRIAKKEAAGFYKTLLWSKWRILELRVLEIQQKCYRNIKIWGRTWLKGAILYIYIKSRFKVSVPKILSVWPVKFAANNFCSIYFAAE